MLTDSLPCLPETDKDGSELSPLELASLAARWRKDALTKGFHPGGAIALTNGCFDHLHDGHLACLRFAKQQALYLIVAMDDDPRVRELKGAGRPLWSYDERFKALALLPEVDLILPIRNDFFNACDSLRGILNLVRPDVLVKGGDYINKQVIGSEIIRKQGGRIAIAPYVTGFSTTAIAGDR